MSNVKAAVDWYRSEKPKYDDLANNLRGLVRALLIARDVAFVDVQGRSKSIASFEEKINKKTYADPVVDVTDLVGIRVITLIESDISLVSDIVSEAFRVHSSSSMDKSEALGADRVGYRSVHLVCDLGEDRGRLPEFRRFSDCKFEVQVRTSLQHAWAEIEHDRGYKLRGTLPSHLKRKFALLAGLLELADSQFDELSQAVDRYAAEVAKKASDGDLNIELNSSSISEFIVLKFGEDVSREHDNKLWESLVAELKDYGIGDLTALNSLFSDSITSYLRADMHDSSLAGLLRGAMMLDDIDRYINSAWKGHWGAMKEETYVMLCRKYGREKIDAVIEENEINGGWV
ncbi:hypothetical protein PRJ39_15905 [Lysobacter enzymogenes]|uniref:GTP pyrophosphokinase n=1 Tax=Lysobacter enzymogenes TaxID=69 RepID=UPI00374A75BF